MRAIDLHDEINPRVAIAPAAAYTTNTAIVSAIIDRSGFESLEFVIETGAITAGATFAVSISCSAPSRSRASPRPTPIPASRSATRASIAMCS